MRNYVCKPENSNRRDLKQQIANSGHVLIVKKLLAPVVLCRAFAAGFEFADTSTVLDFHLFA